MTTTLHVSEIETIAAELRSVAESENCDYPQYDGFWDQWVLGVVERPIDSKWGDRMLTPGDFVLMSPTPRSVPSGTLSETIYVDSTRHWSNVIATEERPARGSNCAIGRGYVSIVEVTA